MCARRSKHYGIALLVLGVAAVGFFWPRELHTEEIRIALLNGTKEEVPGHWNRFLQSSGGLALWCLDSQYASLGTRLALQCLAGMKKEFPRDPPQDFVRWLEVLGLDPSESVPTLKELAVDGSLRMREESSDALHRIEVRASK